MDIANLDFCCMQWILTTVGFGIAWSREVWINHQVKKNFDPLWTWCSLHTMFWQPKDAAGLEPECLQWWWWWCPACGGVLLQSYFEALCWQENQISWIVWFCFLLDVPCKKVLEVHLSASKPQMGICTVFKEKHVEKCFLPLHAYCVHSKKNMAWLDLLFMSLMKFLLVSTLPTTHLPSSCTFTVRSLLGNISTGGGKFALFKIVIGFEALIFGSVLQRHCGNAFWAGVEVRESKVCWMDKVTDLCVSFLLAQANGWACVDFGCSHPIDELLWSLPIYLLGTWLNHVSISFYSFWVVTYLFVSWGFISLWN